MDTVNYGDKVVTRTCPHATGHISYLENNGRSAPILLVEGLSPCVVVTLTNQVIRISCPSCFTLIRHRAEERI